MASGRQVYGAHVDTIRLVVGTGSKQCIERGRSAHNVRRTTKKTCMWAFLTFRLLRCGKAAAAVVSGQVDFSFQNLSAVSGKIEAGQLIPLVVTTPERQKIIENVPTAREVGYQNIEMVIGWSAIYGPPGLPDAVVTKWTDTLQKLKGDRGWNKMTKSLGNIVDIRSPADTKAYVEAQYKAYDKALKKMGLRIE